MWLMDYRGRWHDASVQHPEKYVELAPEHLQRACARAGGKNLRGEPHFRLIRADSRFQICGGAEVCFYDIHGNYQRTIPETVLMPRYIVPRELHGEFILERLMPPEWWYRQNWENGAVEWHGIKATRVLEPVWPQGTYQAILFDMLNPWFFPRNVSADEVFIRVRRFLELSSRPVPKTSMKQLREQVAREEERETDTCVEKVKDLIGPYAFKSHSGYGGGKSV